MDGQLLLHPPARERLLGAAVDEVLDLADGCGADLLHAAVLCLGEVDFAGALRPADARAGVLAGRALGVDPSGAACPMPQLDARLPAPAALTGEEWRALAARLLQHAAEHGRLAAPARTHAAAAADLLLDAQPAGRADQPPGTVR